MPCDRCRAGGKEEERRAEEGRGREPGRTRINPEHPEDPDLVNKLDQHPFHFR